MALDFDGINDRIDYTAGIDLSDGLPLTYALTINRDVAAGGSEYIFNLQNGSTVTHLLYFPSPTVVSMEIQGTTGVLIRSSTASLTDGQMDTFILTWDGSLTAANVHMYVNGSELIYNTTQDGSGTPKPSNNLILFGRTQDDNRNFLGKCANFGVWRAELNAGQRAAYDAGYSPSLIQPDKLVLDDRLIRSSQDLRGSASTLIGATPFPHPRTIFPSAPIIGIPVAAAGGPTLTRNYYDKLLAEAA